MKSQLGDLSSVESTHGTEGLREMLRRLPSPEDFKTFFGVDSPPAKYLVEPASWVTHNIWVPTLKLILAQILRLQGKDVPLGNSVK